MIAIKACLNGARVYARGNGCKAAAPSVRTLIGPKPAHKNLATGAKAQMRPVIEAGPWGARGGDKFLL